MLVVTVQDLYWEPTLFNLAHAYRKERMYDAAIICLEQCSALKESSSAHSALGYCLHLQSMVVGTTTRYRPKHSQLQAHLNLKEDRARRSRSNKLLHQSIDAYHQSLAQKPDDPFASEMLQKALSDALEQTDFFMNDDDLDDVVVNDNNTAMAMSAIKLPGNTTANNVTSGGALASRRQNQNQHHHRHQQTAASRTSLGSQGSLSMSTATGIGGSSGGGGMNQSSLWTEDGLSLSVDSGNDDVDMT